MAQKPIRSTDKSLPISLLRAREKIMDPIRKMLAESQISEQKWRVLRVVAEAGPLEQSKIADLACLLLPSLTRIVQALEKDGLLMRKVDGQDKRRSIVSITDAGNKLIAQHSEQSNKILSEIETQLGEEKLETLFSILDDIRNIRI